MAGINFGLVLLSVVGSGFSQPDFIKVCQDGLAPPHSGPWRQPEGETEAPAEGAVPKGCWAETAQGYVYCIGVPLTSIPQNLPRSTTCLVIQQGRITNVDASAINYLPNLRVLGLFANPLVSVSGAFTHPILDVLVLSGGNLTSVPSITSGKLRHLNLNNNAIGFLDLTPATGNPLRRLDIGGNPFTTLPRSEIAMFANSLNELYMQPSHVEEINSVTFPALPYLRTLYVAAYTLKADAFVGVATQLDKFYFRTCTIESNALRGIQLTSLKLGYTQNCRDTNQGLTIQPGSFSGMERLESLDLDNTKLSYVPSDAFQGLPSLSSDLLIEFNQIETIEAGAFSGLEKVSRLRLTNNYNHNTTWPDTIFSEPGLLNLTLLDLSSFNIRDISEITFKNLPKLIYLYLGFNQMSRMSEGVLTPVLPHLQRLSLYANPWICDCKLRWMRELFDKQRSIFDSGTTYLWKCSEPPHLKGRIFTDLKPSDFVC